MPVQVAAETYNLRQLIYKRGEPVQIINRTTLTGANPAPNPPTAEGLVVNGATAHGATTISFRASVLTGRLISGDQFTIAGDSQVYTVNAQAISPPTADILTGVTFSPGIVPVGGEADGAAVTLIPSAVVSVPMALVTHYPPALITGNTTGILMTDRRVRVLTSDLGSLVPLPGMLVILTTSGETYSILNVKTVRDAGTVFAYFMQVRR